jgi:hypothetical protein
MFIGLRFPFTALFSEVLRNFWRTLFNHIALLWHKTLIKGSKD